MKKKMECLSESVKRMINSVFFRFICKIALELLLLLNLLALLIKKK